MPCVIAHAVQTKGGIVANPSRSPRDWIRPGVLYTITSSPVCPMLASHQRFNLGMAELSFPGSE